MADVILMLHASLVAFNIVSLLLIIVGLCRRWRWVRNFWFRIAHLLAIFVVVSQAWAGVVCPLTTWENWFRGQAGEVTSPGSFVGYWVHQLLYYEADPSVFVVAYTVFGALVLVTFLVGRPVWPGRMVSAHLRR